MKVALAYKAGYGKVSGIFDWHFIYYVYLTSIFKDLVDNIKSETSGDFLELLKSLLMPNMHLEAIAVEKAIKVCPLKIQNYSLESGPKFQIKL